jgi:replication factor C large subunit
MDPWVKKYAPQTPDDVVGQDAAIVRVRAYLAQFRRGQRPLLLSGPTGIGKTSLVHALAGEMDIEVLEVNASDARSKAAIEQLVGAAAMQASLFMRRRVILVDEVDGVSGTGDRGGIPALVDIIGRSAHPIVFTATDAHDDKLKALRKVAEIVTLPRIDTGIISQRLLKIARAERVALPEDVAQRLALRSGGDLRAAITDLQSLAGGSGVTKEEVDALSDREHEQQLEKALSLVLKTTQLDVARAAFDNVREEPDRIMLWLEENIAREYALPQDLARAMDALAEGDRFFGRVRRWQYYRFYVYVYALLSAGVALAKDGKYSGAFAAKEPSRLLTIWMYNQKNAKRKRLAEQLAPQLHTSRKRVARDVLPYLRLAWKSKAFADSTRVRYGLDEEACAWLEK